MASADVSSKWLIGQSPEAWVQWVLIDSSVVVEEFLSTEFQHVSRLSDSLLRVRDQSGEKLETVLALFASFVLNTETIQQIVRWNMTILRESPWYQEILEEGIKQGNLKGQRETILNFLRARFEFTPETETALSEKLASIEDSKILQSLVIVAAQAENVEVFSEALDEHIPTVTD